ncbi:unnamed protein product [Trichogramma brassicae]|uniref:pyridoxal 5'-phosphate synthase n=1 Tax=Trichogramma brassicae TaxID=86971 RepID=A0A6H5I7F5_9HYME|nr:unnamed protein product [Trichogramma brassicae]
MSSLTDNRSSSVRGYSEVAGNQPLIANNINKNSNNLDEISDLCYVDVKSDNPYDLFKEWHKEACVYSTGLPHALCLSTVSKDMKVSSRHVVLRRIEEDGFCIYTDNRSRKTKELTEVPEAAMCFLWAYINDKGQKVARQVRIEGEVVVMDKDAYADLYDKDKLFCKIRAYICHQDKEVDWNELKAKHDQLLEDVRQNKVNLPMPDHLYVSNATTTTSLYHTNESHLFFSLCSIGYKMLPKAIEFYYARDTLIGDRILFEKSEDSNQWSWKRIAA